VPAKDRLDFYSFAFSKKEQRNPEVSTIEIVQRAQAKK
jgi:hypothetical protein